MASPANFTATAKWFHWLSAVLMLSVLSEAAQFAFRAPEDKVSALPAHASVAALVVALTLLRSAWRAGHKPPAMPAPAPSWMKRAAHLGHGALYGLIFFQGVVGVTMAAASPADIRLFSGFNLSSLAPADPALYAVLAQLHAAGAIAFAIVLAGHIGAALWHHFVLKDDVLKRMTPFYAVALADRAKADAAAQRFPSSAPGFDWRHWRRRPRT
jgi:cytochrome b561